MAIPETARRTLIRMCLGGLAASLALAIVGAALERGRFGRDATAARARVESDVRAHFAAIDRALASAVSAARPDANTLRLAEQGFEDRLRELFDRVRGAVEVVDLADAAITIAGSSGAPIAWHGRPGAAPDLRAAAPRVFLATGPQGLRVVRVEPLVDAADGQRIGAVVGELPLASDGGAQTGGGDYVLPTRTVAVSIRPQFESAGAAERDVFIVEGTGGTTLASVAIPAEALEGARRAFRGRWIATALIPLLLTVLLTSGPLLEWRRATRSVLRALVLTGVMGTMLVIVRVFASFAIDLAGLRGSPLTAGRELEWATGWLFGSSTDLLLTSLLVAAWVALAGSGLDLWRAARRGRAGRFPVAHAMGQAAFLATQALAGGLAGWFVMAHQAVLIDGLSSASVDLLHFGLSPWEWRRVAAAAGLVILHAAVAGAGVIVLRAALAPWLFPSSSWPHRVRAAVVWVVGGLAVAAFDGATWSPPTIGIVLPLLFIAASAWCVGAYRATLRHASQGVRLVAFFLAIVLPSVAFYPSLVTAANRASRRDVELRFAPEAANQRRDLQSRLTSALAQIDRIAGLADAIAGQAAPVDAATLPADAAFFVWSQTVLASQRLTSNVELYGPSGDLVSRFALKLPDVAGAQSWTEASCTWEVFEEVSPFFGEDRRLLHAGRALCESGPDGRVRRHGSIAVHVMLDYGNLSFISARSPYVALLRAGGRDRDPERRPVGFSAYGWSRASLYTTERIARPISDTLFRRAYQTREPFWDEVRQGDEHADAYVLNDRGGIFVLSLPRSTAMGHLVNLAELVTLVFLTFAVSVGGAFVFGLLAGRTPASGRALLREVRASFSRKLFLAFVLASIVPVLALALVARAYVASLMLADIETEATRTASVASRVAQDFSSLQSRGLAALPPIDDNVVVWLSRVIAEDVNIFAGPDLLASSERNLFASGLLSTRTSGDVYRAILLEGRPSYVARESAAGFEYLVSAAPVQVQGQTAILTVPLTSRQQELTTQIAELDRRVLLAALLVIMLGSGLGYSMAERIADPVNRLMRATQRIAHGDLDARVLVTSSDELRRLVEAFNRMAADLRRQRVELERTNRLAAWADMARQVAHDIKNPLTPIQLNAEHLQRVHADRGRPLGPVIDDCVASILLQVRLLRQIAAEFSSFASSPQPRPAATDLPSLVADIVNPYRAGLEGRVAFDVRIAGGVTAWIDRVLVGRALTNVIENALHAMPAGGTLHVRAASRSAEVIDLVVEDTGVGMDAESMSHIFEPYFSTKATGTGLGLTIAKRNVEANLGSIQIESTPGRGTKVTLSLPAAREAR